jgi:hypothetical protein
MKPALLAAFAVTFAAGQTRPQAFDVASVKPHKWTMPARVGISFQGNTLHAHHQALEDLIVFAYNLKGGFQLSGLPDWARNRGVMDTESFEIEAKAAQDQTPTRDEFRLMHQFHSSQLRSSLVQCCHGAATGI